MTICGVGLPHLRGQVVISCGTETRNKVAPAQPWSFLVLQLSVPELGGVHGWYLAVTCPSDVILHSQSVTAVQILGQRGRLVVFRISFEQPVF